jgi:hypothetical protein
MNQAQGTDIFSGAPAAQPIPAKRVSVPLSRSACLLVLIPAAVLVGCSSVPFYRGNTAPTPGLRIASPTPGVAEIVASLNANAQRVQAVQCADIDLDCQQGAQAVGLRGGLICQKPRNFRMTAKVMGNVAVDIGSNNQEFWFWISKAEPPYLYHCSYQDYAQGVRLPFPFQPDWITEAIGIAEYDPNKQYEVAATTGGVDLVESTVSPQGQPIRKITRLARGRSGQWQVTGHIVQDANNKNADGSYREICAATVMDLQQDPTSGAILPRRLLLEWPAEKLKLQMKINQLAVNPANLSADRVATLFTRPTLRDVPSFDLARGADTPGPGLRPAGYR